MFIRYKERANGKCSVQIVESKRLGDKVRQNIVRHVGQAENNEEKEALTKLAKTIIFQMENQKQPFLPSITPEDIFCKKKKKEACNDNVKIKDLREDQRMVDGIGDVFGKLYTDLGFDKLITGTKKDEAFNGILKSCVLARLANPVSKRRTAALLEQDYGIKIPLQKIYNMMDHLAKREDKIKKDISFTTTSLFANRVDVLFFDVTTLYFESAKTDELKKFGFSKDMKFNEVQVVLALVVTTDGLPITYKLFPGNMYEGNTLVEMIKEMKKEYDIKNVMLVADRAMFNEKNLKMMEDEGINYIVAAKLKGLAKSVKDEIISSDLYRPGEIEGDLYWTNEFKVNGRRLIVTYNRTRAEKDASDRQRLIERLLRRMKNGKIKIKDVISNYGTKRYLKMINNEVEIDESKISEDAKWDGLHGVMTNMKGASPIEIISRYKSLWQIEEAFRVNKHDLKMRPIFHFTPSRIKAHILICFLAYTIAKQALYRIRLTKKLSLSFERLREELLHVQSSILLDIRTKRRYVLPSNISSIQQRIYEAFGIRHSTVPYRLE